MEADTVLETHRFDSRDGDDGKKAVEIHFDGGYRWSNENSPHERQGQAFDDKDER